MAKEILIHKSDELLSIIRDIKPSEPVDFIGKILAPVRSKHDRISIINRTEDSGWSAFNLATRIGRADIVSTLLDQVDDLADKFQILGLKDRSGSEPIRVAALYGKSDVIRAILDVVPTRMHFDILSSQNDEEDTILHSSILGTDSATIRIVMDYAARVGKFYDLLNIKNCKLETPLHLAINRCTSEFFAELVSRIDPSKRLEYFSEQDTYGNTALHIAALQDDISYLHNILESLPPRTCKKTFMYILNKMPMTTLHFLVLKNKPEEIQYLLRDISEADRIFFINKHGENGMTALHLAASNKNPDLIKVLLESLQESDRALIVDSVNYEFETPLHIATKSGNTESLEAILELLPEKDRILLLRRENSYSETPLDIAVRLRNISAFKAIKKAQIDEDYEAESYMTAETRGSIDLSTSSSASASALSDLPQAEEEGLDLMGGAGRD